MTDSSASSAPAPSPAKFGSELQKRVLTGAVGAAAMMVLLVWGGWVGICLLASILSFAMIFEFSQMAFTSADAVAKRYAMLFLTWLVCITNALAPHNEFELLIFCFLFLFAYFLFAADKREGEAFTSHFKELEYSIFGLLYLVFLPLFLTRIYGGANGRHWAIVFLLMVWAGDVAAYFVGIKYGKQKLYPHISPKKSREGAYGGLAGSLIVSILYKLIFFRAMPWGAVIFVPLVVGAVAQVGDLCESFMKRVYGKKDSSSLLPGHGGFLDRFDGVVFSLPVMYACTRIFS